MKKALRHLVDILSLLFCHLAMVQIGWSTPESCILRIQADAPTKCTGQTVELSVNMSTSMLMNCDLTFHWQHSIGQGSWTDLPEQGATLDYVVTDAETYKFRALLVCMDCGSDTLLSNTLQVVVYPVPGVGIEGDVSVCTGASSMLEAKVSNSATGLMYQWDTGETTASVSVVNNIAGLSTYAVTVTDDKGCSSTSSHKIDVRARPVIEVAGITERCAGIESTLKATVTGGFPDAVKLLQWSNDGSGSSDIITLSGNLQPGAYMYRVDLKQVDSGGEEYPGCMASKEIAVNLYDLPTFNLETDDDTICVGGSVFFRLTDLAGGIPGVAAEYKYQLNSGDIVVINADNFTINNLYSGGYFDVKVTAEQDVNTGCVFNNSKVVYVSADPSVTIQDNVTVCQGSTVTLKAVPNGGTGNGATYKWIRKDGLNETVLQVTDALLSTDPLLPPGNYCYIVTLTQNEKGCSATSGCVSSNVAPSPEVSLRIDNNGPSTICTGGSVKFTADLTGGLSCALEWQSSSDSIVWSSINGVSGNSYTGTFNQSGKRYLRVKTTNCNTGCRADTSGVVVITIKEDPVITGISVSPNEICAGGESSLFAQSTGGTGTCSINWDWQSQSGGSWSGTGITGSQLSVGSGQVYGTLVPGTKKYRAVIACDGVGCDASTFETNLVVKPDLTVTVTPQTPTELCGGALLKLDAVAQGGVSNCTVLRWQRAVGSGLFQDIPPTTPQSQYLEVTSVAGAYQYRAIATCNESGCESGTSTPVPVRVKQTPPILANWPASEPSVCKGVDTYTLDARPGDSYSSVQYTWFERTDVNSGWQNILISGNTFNTGYIAVPTYYKAEVQTECGTAFKETLVRVIPQPDTKILHGPTNACTGQTAMYTVQSPPELIDDQAQIEWSIVPASGGTVVNTYNYNAGVVIRWAASGTYKLRVTHSRGGCQGTSEILVSVAASSGTPLSASPIHHYQFNNLLIATDSTAFCYQWYRYDLQTNIVEKIAGEQFQAYVASDDYAPNRYAYFVKTWNGSCENESACAVVSYDVQEKSELQPVGYSRLTVFPNPNRGAFNITASDMPEHVVISIADVNAREVWTKQFDCRGGLLSEWVQLSEPAGVYLITVTDSRGSGYRKTLRFVIAN